MDNDFKTKLQSVVDKIEPDSRAGVQQDIDLVLQTGASTYADWLAILQNKQTNANIRSIVCWTLARFKDERALPALLEALKDEAPSLRAEAARALGTLDNKQAVEPIITALREDKDVDVRVAAAYALGLLGDKRAVEPLISLLNDQSENSKLRGMVAEVLADLMDRRAITPLIAALKDNSVEVRFWAAFALGELGATEALQELQRLATLDRTLLPDWWSVSEEATRAIQRIQDDRPHL